MRRCLRKSSGGGEVVQELNALAALEMDLGFSSKQLRNS